MKTKNEKKKMLKIMKKIKTLMKNNKKKCKKLWTAFKKKKIKEKNYEKKDYPLPSI